MFLCKNSVIVLAAFVASAASSAYQGFNYGSTNPDGSAAVQADFQNYFTTAKNLVGHSGFTSARLYTMIQQGTTSSVIEAIPAAIDTHTSLLLGMWASAGQESFNNELAALKSAIDTYGDKLTGLVAGLSVGSEDLYRETPIGIKSKAGPGASAATISSYIAQARKVLAGTVLSGVPVGHVDTWTAYVNSSNTAAITACDWLGVDTYPYYQKTDDNTIERSATLFDEAYQNTLRVSQGKDVWITETGWPISGSTSGQAVASAANAKKYWDKVACKYLGKINMYWYTLYDGTPNPSFGLVGSTLSTQPVFDLSCPKVVKKPKTHPAKHTTKVVKSKTSTHTHINHHTTTMVKPSHHTHKSHKTTPAVTKTLKFPVPSHKPHKPHTTVHKVHKHPHKSLHKSHKDPHKTAHKSHKSHKSQKDVHKTHVKVHQDPSNTALSTKPTSALSQNHDPPKSNSGATFGVGSLVIAGTIVGFFL